jgi:hypothetical protein
LEQWHKNGIQYDTFLFLNNQLTADSGVYRPTRALADAPARCRVCFSPHATLLPKQLTKSTLNSTRKIQAVDFGFSFGSPTGGAPALSIAQQLESVPEATTVTESTVDTTLPNATAPVTEQSTRETPTRILRNSTAATESPRRSDRISIGRVSTPNNTTEEQEEGRSSKRRRISKLTSKTTTTSY